MSAFETFSLKVQHTLREMEELNETYEVMRPATLSPKLMAAGKEHVVRLWSVSRATGELLYAQVIEQKPRVILELGTSAGYSGIWLALAAQTYGGKIITIDSSVEKQGMAREFAAQVGVESSITFLHGAISDVLQNWEPTSIIDMVFLDADKKNYLRFYELLLPHRAPQHSLIADDAVKYQEAMQLFLSRIQNDPAYISVLHPEDHGLFITRSL